MAKGDREVAFANESFLIGVLQAVSGGALVVVIAQAGPLKDLAGKFPPLIVLTTMAAALFVAVIAAYYKQEYEKWDLKAQTSKMQGYEEEAGERLSMANKDLGRMRNSMGLAICLIGVGIAVLLGAMWCEAVYAP